MGYKSAPMKALRQLFFACVAMFCLTGCLQVEKLVKLNADGSGTVEETVIMTKAAIQGIKQMAAGFGAGAKDVPSKPFEVFDEAKVKEAAAKMGEGVTYVSGTKVTSDLGEGYKAVYAFTDINKLKVDQSPGSSMSAANGPQPKGDEKKKEPVGFRYTKGSPSELAITMPEPDFKGKKGQPEGAEDFAMQMMQQMLKDMKITLAVEVAGAIQETNAEYRDGPRVTLMEVDMNKLLGDPAKFKELVKASPSTLQEGKALLKSIDGVKVETAPEVKIKFQ